MGYLFKRTRKNRQGERVEGKRWYIRFTDVDGQERTEAAFTDKAKGHQLLARRMTEAADGQKHVGDRYKKHRATRLAAHVRDFVTSLQANGCGPPTAIASSATSPRPSPPWAPASWAT